MEPDWTRLGAELKAARDARSYTQAAVAEMIGVKRGTMRNIENGDIARVTPTVRAYARAVGWDDSSVDAVLAGGTPTQAADQGAGARDIAAAENLAAVEPPEELPLRIQAALREGPLIDTAVINLPGDDDGPEGQMVVIVKGRNGATPEQLKRALLRWEEAEVKLRRTDSTNTTDHD
ncbi:helix-turn-helix domain-containing protein [Streptomyces sioyaensis]|uniref:helix-turn-helix domain-containing protein n=1 Tax=Streptomyces sioyaensis TaxID=67364 RepID=UPI003D70B81F